MGSGNPEITLDEVSAVLFDEFKQGGTLSPKAFHKITYFIEQTLSEQGYETDIEYFWYKYGTMTATADSSIAIEPSGERSEVLCSISTGELSIDPELEDVLRTVTRDVLTEYDQLATEGLTNRMYEDAPYDFQRAYRVLDTTIQTELKSGSGEDVKFDRQAIRAQLHEFIEVFPEDDFAGHLNDLYLWFDILSTALDDDTVTLGDIEEITEIFWTIVMLDLATDPETGIDSGTLADELNIDDPAGLQGHLSYQLQQLKRERLYVGEVADYTSQAADAAVMSQFDFVEI